MIERLDKCLLDHIVNAGTKEGGPQILDAYQLQGLSEIHYYLKVEHEFTPDEVSALMDFSDPLAVAQECWEERTPEKGFPICELLKEIHAYERFPLVNPEGRARGQAQLEQTVKAVLDQNMKEFHASLLTLDKEEIIAKSAEIAAMREAYDFMKEYFKFERGDAEILLRMENPLKFVAEQWPSDIAGMFDMSDQIGEAIEEAGQRAASEHEHGSKAAVTAEKPSVREQLRTAMKEARQQPAPEERPKGGEAR